MALWTKADSVAHYNDLRIQTLTRTIIRYQLRSPILPPWPLNGITPRLIESQYQGDYGSALRRLNAITEGLEALDPTNASAEVVNRLKRRRGGNLNSTLLHQLCFANLGDNGRTVLR